MSDTDGEGQSGNDAAARFRTYPGGVRRSQAGNSGRVPRQGELRRYRAPKEVPRSCAADRSGVRS
ncbi:MAG: hypothetical protein LC749_19825 [Actinobacteria bacterium]|nr:hypothetical protein [Actinomycetota bacterium]